jgi:hypothetical protein
MALKRPDVSRQTLSSMPEATDLECPLSGRYRRESRRDVTSRLVAIDPGHLGWTLSAATAYLVAEKIAAENPPGLRVAA